MASNDSGARERILGRIRQATAQNVAGAGAPSKSSVGLAGVVDLAEIFPSVGDIRARFLAECTANLMEPMEAADVAASSAALAKVLATLPEGDLYVQDAPVLRSLVERAAVKRPVRWSSQGKPAESTQASLTLAHAFVAQTGSILISSACGGRGSSIVPPCHIVYGTGSQIVTDISAALALAQVKGWTGASYAGLISGSSRTADIEKILVQGAHGPRRLVVILEGK